MILRSLDITCEEFESQSGWSLRPEGACKGDRCIPLPGRETTSGRVDVALLSQRLGMPLLHDEAHGVYALGPETTGRVLESASCPEIVLEDLDGQAFSFSSLRGRKVVMVAWASW